MTFATSGDGARFASFNQDATRLKSQLQRLTSELASGRKDDLGDAVGGNFTGLSEVTRNLRLNESYLNGLSNAATAAAARQATLERLGAELDNTGPELLAVVSDGRSTELDLRLAESKDRLEGAIASLNTRAGGQNLFSGNAPDQPALADADTILDALRPIATGAPDVATAIAQIDAWFQDAGGGYDTVAYLGGTGEGGAVYLAEGEVIETAVSATEPSIRTALSGLAMAALAAEGSLPVEEDAQAMMAEAAATRIIAGEDGLIDTQARLGVSEGRIEEARVRAETFRSTLQLEEARLTSADPYDAATEIEAVELQLESLYILTARLANLTLANYLR